MIKPITSLLAFLLLTPYLSQAKKANIRGTYSTLDMVITYVAHLEYYPHHLAKGDAGLKVRGGFVTIESIKYKGRTFTGGDVPNYTFPSRNKANFQLSGRLLIGAQKQMAVSINSGHTGFTHWFSKTEIARVRQIIQSNKGIDWEQYPYYEMTSIDISTIYMNESFYFSNLKSALNKVLDKEKEASRKKELEAEKKQREKQLQKEQENQRKEALETPTQQQEEVTPQGNEQRKQKKSEENTTPPKKNQQYQTTPQPNPNQKYLDEKRRRAEREAAERKRQQEFNNWKNTKQKQNQVAAASMGASGALALYLIGKVIYEGMGNFNPYSAYQNGPSFYVGLQFGYSMLSQPMQYRSVKVQSSGGTKSTNEVRHNIPLLMNFQFRMGYDDERIGVIGNFKASAGTSLLFNHFSLSPFNYGGRIFGGLPNAKAYFSYNRGRRNFFYRPWINPTELGESTAKINYSEFGYGLKFTWGQFERHHVYVGLTHEKPTAAAGTGNKTIIRTVEDKDPEKHYVTGFFFEWKKDHSSSLFINMKPTYPFVGSSGKGEKEGGFFIETGFLRAVDWYN